MLESQRSSQREHVPFVGPILDRCPPEGLDRVISVTDIELVLTALIPLGGVTEAHLAVAGGDRASHEERGNCQRDQQHNLQNLTMDEVGPCLDGFGIAWGTR
jgi:hypothetical protein